MYMYIYIYTFIYICICISIYFMYMCIYSYLCLFDLRSCVNFCTHLRSYLFVRVAVGVDIGVLCACVCVCVYACVCLCVCVFVCMCEPLAGLPKTWQKRKNENICGTLGWDRFVSIFACICVCILSSVHVCLSVNLPFYCSTRLCCDIHARSEDSYGVRAFWWLHTSTQTERRSRGRSSRK